MKKILFVNSINENCGVFQYGKRTFDILKKTINYNFFYIEVSDKDRFFDYIRGILPDAIIYNYHPSTLSWVNSDLILPLDNITHYGIHHEGDFPAIFDYDILTDSTRPDDTFSFSVPRPLFEDAKTIDYGEPQFPIIGSFGFGFHNKGFERLVKMANDEFERCTIRLNIPFAYYGDINGDTAKSLAERCRYWSDPKRTNLVITHDFMKDSVLLNFLSSNTLNCFLYDRMPGRGLSSAIDYALSVDVPIAISDSEMFRHLSVSGGLNNSLITVGGNSLKEIISRGTGVLKQYKEKWSNEKFISKYEYILKLTL